MSDRDFYPYLLQILSIAIQINESVNIARWAIACEMLFHVTKTYPRESSKK